MTLPARLTVAVVLILGMALAMVGIGASYALKGVLVSGQAQILRQEATRVIHDLQVHHRFPTTPPAVVQAIGVYGPRHAFVRGLGPRMAEPPLPDGVTLLRGTMWYIEPMQAGQRLVIRASDRSVDAPVNDLNRILLLISAGVLLLGAFAAVRAARTLTGPVSLLAERVRLIAETGEITESLPEGAGAPEVRALSRDMNQMLRTLKETFMAMEASQHREVALREMAAHLLRNPLATVLANLDLLQRNTLGDKASRRALGLARLEAARLRDRIEEIVSAPMHGSSDLAAVARGVAGTLPVHIVGVSPVVAVPAAEVSEVLGILLDNAVRHNPEGTTVDVTVGRGANASWIRVRDTGIGMSPDVRARAFDRGFKGDDRGGLGLGLALARALVAARGGSIALDSAPGRGTIVEVRWPYGLDARGGETGGGAKDD